MPVRFRSHLKLLVAVLLVLSVCMVEASAQTRKKRRSRRASKPVVAKPVITNPVIAPPGDTVKNSSGDVKIISTADLNSTEADQEAETPPSKKTRSTTKVATDGDDMQQTISTLSNQVNKLKQNG